ncbi:MAG: hypothetical protein K0Q79_1213 [Flavipsychrobacter sp.]|jgi:hypothetical protein|nr:hypothetical protein [Flavipsychrobacter sp.]
MVVFEAGAAAKISEVKLSPVLSKCGYCLVKESKLYKERNERPFSGLIC